MSGMERRKDPTRKKVWDAIIIGELGERRIIKCSYCGRETPTKKAGRVRCRDCRTTLRLPGFTDGRFK